MSYLQAGDVRLAWQQMGEGPDVVLVHGLATSRAFWYANLAQHLRAGYRVTLFDLRGHGYSSRPATGYTPEAMAADVDALVQGLELSPVALIGHSYGGAVALEYALRFTHQLQALVVMDARIHCLQPFQWFRDSPHLSAFEEEMALADGRDWDAEPQIGLAFLEAMARLRVGGYAPQARDAFSPFSEGKGGLRTAKAFCDLLDDTSARADFLAAHGSDAATIAGLQLPVQLIYGETSRNLPSAHALAGCLPHAEQNVIPRAGHFFPFSHAQQVARLVGSFLESASSRAIS